MPTLTGELALIAPFAGFFALSALIVWLSSIMNQNLKP